MSNMMIIKHDKTCHDELHDGHPLGRKNRLQNRARHDGWPQSTIYVMKVRLPQLSVGKPIDYN